MSSNVKTLTIHSLGAKGDGICFLDDNKIFIEGALEGEVVNATIDSKSQNPIRAKIKTITSPSPNRIQPPCPHYKKCGACTMQHIEKNAYQSWKNKTVKDTLTQKNIIPKSWDTSVFLENSRRRRATFHGIKSGDTLTVGYHGKQSHNIFNLRECIVLDSDIVAIQNRIKIDFAPLIPPKGKFTLFIQKIDNGIDVAFTGPLSNKGEPDLQALEAINSVAHSTNIIRFSWRENSHDDFQTLIELEKPIMQFGDLSVAIQPLAFLQPSIEGQKTLTDIVTNYLPSPAQSIADLFCGYGTFTGALLSTSTHSIHAYEGEKDAITALKNSGFPNAHHRDLFRDPLDKDELNKFDCIVIDPPRAGAKSQVEHIARSNIETVIFISCNPSTFARDSLILIDSGYELERITLVDQFIYTPHAELVALFKKNK